MTENQKRRIEDQLPGAQIDWDKPGAPAVAQASLEVQCMADCMDMVRQELIEAGVIDSSVPPMMIANAVLAHLGKVVDSVKKEAAAPSLAAAELTNYDPNMTWAEQRVRLTLKQWDYTATLETTVGGNCQGFEIFQSAIDRAYSELPAREHHGDDYAYVTLTRANGDTLECEDDELRGEDWLAQMVTGIEIIEQEPEKSAQGEKGRK